MKRMSKIRILGASVAVALVFLSVLRTSFGQEQPKVPDPVRVELVVVGQSHVGKSLAVKVALRNTGNSAIQLPQSLMPEGWLIRFRIRDSGGRAVYSSAVAKVEMTASQFELMQVAPRETRQFDMEIKAALPAGDYALDGWFSTLPLSKRKVEGLPIGTWSAEPVSVRVVPE
jgi:hypothetical protein